MRTFSLSLMEGNNILLFLASILYTPLKWETSSLKFLDIKEKQYWSAVFTVNTQNTHFPCTCGTSRLDHELLCSVPPFETTQKSSWSSRLAHFSGLGVQRNWFHFCSTLCPEYLVSFYSTAPRNAPRVSSMCLEEWLSSWSFSFLFCPRTPGPS